MRPSWRKMRSGVIVVVSMATFAIVTAATPSVSQAQLATSAWPMFHHDASPGQKQTLTVEFSPTLPLGRVSATLLITSNDPKHPQVKVKLTGVGVAGK